jgi:hypothetical protein
VQPSDTEVTEIRSVLAEVMGQVVAEAETELRRDIAVVAAEHRTAVAELKADFAERWVKFVEQVQQKLADIKLPAEQKEPEVSESEFKLIVDRATPKAAAPVSNINVSVNMPKKGKEITTVELDEQGRIKRSVKQEEDE